MVRGVRLVKLLVMFTQGGGSNPTFTKFQVFASLSWLPNVNSFLAEPRTSIRNQTRVYNSSKTMKINDKSHAIESVSRVIIPLALFSTFDFTKLPLSCFFLVQCPTDGDTNVHTRDPCCWVGRLLPDRTHIAPYFVTKLYSGGVVKRLPKTY